MEIINGYKVSIYDNGGKTFDRITFFIEKNKEIGQVYGSSLNPFSPQGFGMYVGDSDKIKKGKHLGNKVSFKDCFEEVQKHILSRMN